MTQLNRLRLLAVVSGALALLLLGRLGVFMQDSSRTSFSLIPGSQRETTHSCLSAYFVAAQAAGQGREIYDEALYSLPGDPTRQRVPRTLGIFLVDVYEYPPPFLLLPRALQRLTPDFERFRFAWFVLNTVTVLVAMVAIARSLGEPAATRALLLLPLAWVALPTLSALQKGNVQLVVVALSMVAMLLIERGHRAAGGLLLAAAIASKLFPGLLVVYLLVRRQWRALAWTAAWGLAITAATAIALGFAPLRSFLAHLPGLLGGEAFPIFRNPAAMANNFSIPGLVFKLKVLGIGNLSFGASKAVGWLYTLVAVWATVALARRAHSPREAPVVWLAILVMATLRSPFLPQAYAAFPPIWLLTLLAAGREPDGKSLALTLAAWAAMNVMIPIDWITPPRLALVSFIPLLTTLAVAALAVRHALTRAEARPLAVPAESVA
jgi:hypothetical protein